MKVKKLFIIFVSLSMLLLTGCSGSVQLHERMVVQGIGIDITDSGYKVTMQALDFKNPAGENEPSVKVLELNGRTLLETLDNVSKQSGLIPLYSQNLIVVVGRDAAVLGIDKFLDFFIRHYEARPNVKICVSEKTAADILSIETDNGVMQAKDISDLIPNELNSDILHFVGSLQGKTSDPNCAYLDVEEKDKKKSVSIKGLTFFNGDKFSGSVVDTECLAALAVMGVGNLGIYNVSVNDIGLVSLDIDKVKSQIKPYLSEKDKSFEINVDIEASVLEVTPHLGTRIGSNEQLRIEKQLDNEMQKICRQVVDKIIKSDSDIFKFGKVLMNNNPSYFKEISDSWKDNMKTFNYTVNVSSKLTITGTEI